MKRSLFVSFVMIGVLFLASWHMFSPPAQAGGDAPKVTGLSGKPIFIQAKDGVAFTLEKVQVQQLGGRTFLVGRELLNASYKLTKEQFGGATVWVPVDAVTQIVELEPPIRGK